MFKASAVFLANYNATKKIVVNQGGTSAGKTYSIIQVLFAKAIYFPNSVTTVVGVDVPMLKKGALRDAHKIVRESEELKAYVKDFNKSDRIFLFKNGSIMEFSSFENEQDARGGRRDFLYINECNSIDYLMYWQLSIRTSRQIFLDYNPSSKFYVHHKILPLPETQLIISDHRHNPFIPRALHDEIEGITDPELFKVYARGMTGQVKGAIFRFKKVDKIPTRTVVDADGKTREVELDFGFGMDIGYTTDKTTIVKVCINGKDHYYQELLYKSNDEIQDDINEKSLKDAKGNPLTIEGYINNILIANGMTKATMVWGDHDKAMSNKLRRMGVPYRMAKKGPNSVVASISSVKRYNGFMYNSPNLEDETKVYIWQTAIDVLTGNEVSTGEPVDNVPDHCIAAVRYFEHSYAMRYTG